MVKRHIKIALILLIILLIIMGVLGISRSIIKNGYDSINLVQKKNEEVTPHSLNKKDSVKVTYDASSLDVDKENYILKNSSSDKEIENTNSILSYIESVYQEKLSTLSSDNSADPSKTLVVQYKEDVNFSTVLSEYNYIAIVYGANIIDFLGDNCVLYSYKPDDNKDQYIVYDYSDLNSFEKESKVGQEDSLNITSSASKYESYNGADIIYTKGVKIQ